MKNHTGLIIILLAFLATSVASAQENGELLKQAAQLHNKYQFDKAIEIYKSILAQRPDSLLKTEEDTLFNIGVESRLINSENGKNLLLFASYPTITRRESFPAENFFLRLPGFEDGSWVPVPKEFTPQSDGNPFNVMNFVSGKNILIFSAPDESGSWNLISSVKINDTLWSAPQILNENVTTMGNEILPHLSRDGKRLYFASNGHYGMGGYDLYMSEWNDELGDWDVAQNLGFPYSSTADDFMFYNTPDKAFTVLASTRDAEKGKINLYVAKYEALPLKKEVAQQDALQMSELNITGEVEVVKQEEKREELPVEESEYNQYAQAVKEVREVQDKLKSAIAALDKERELYSNTTDSLKKIEMEAAMLQQESDILSLSELSTSAITKLQKIELDFLSKGIIIANEVIEEEEEVIDEMPPMEFHFVQNRLGDSLSLVFEVPEPSVDLSFKILDEAVITELSEIPSGLVYHIQLMTTTRKAPLKSLRGMNPVFERKLSSGKYTYSAGLFYTYSEALRNLNTVRKKGFPTALITAYNNGKSISTKNARVLEKQDNSIYRVTIAGYDVLPAEALAVIREKTNKDIAKAAIDGVMKYVIGPFNAKSQAEELAAALTSRQVTAVEVEKVDGK